MRVDLHCHSTCSDGSQTPAQIAQLARERELELLCLTDHDSMAGHPATVGAAPRVLRGLELSCRDRERSVHVLCYGVRPGPGMDALQARLDQIQHVRIHRIRLICAKLDGLGIHLDADAILARAEGRTAGRPDVARALVEAGAVPTTKDAFTRYLRDGGPADVPIARLSPAEGVELAVAAGARCSLAHPHTLGAEHATDLLRAHRDRGLEGLEAWYGRYSDEERRRWADLADAHGLVVTGGSDFHGDLVPEVPTLGVELPPPRAEALLAWLEPALTA